MTYVKARKIKMGQIFRDEEVIPVTLISIEKGAKAVFEVGSKVKISGKSKGRGFQGVVKRHGFHGGPKSHGQKHTLRAPGSIGATGPQRVLPGTKMAGRMGNTTTTIKNLEVASFDEKMGLLMLKGAVPGRRGSELKIFLNKNED